MIARGLTIREAAEALGVSGKTLRRAIDKLRGVIGPVKEGVFAIHGRRVAFRQRDGVRNNEYHLWLDMDSVPDTPPDLPDPVQVMLDRLTAVELAITELRARVDQMEGKAGPQ